MSFLGETMTLRVVELFAGVGGFRIGFESLNNKKKSNLFEVIWSNQWEPSTKKQHAAEIYVRQWGMEPLLSRENYYEGNNKDYFVNEDISKVKLKDIPSHDLLCGGFPCQDYSVATTKAKGLQGKKGVLWWEILRIIKSKTPKYVLLENVDRLLKSPVTQRGRDFAIMLASLDELGYIVEWRIIDASEYGFPQRRKRVFLIAYSPKSKINKRLKRLESPKKWIEEGIIANSFPIKPLQQSFEVRNFRLKKNTSDSLADITNQFNANGSRKSPFDNSGIMVNGIVWSVKTEPMYYGKKSKLRDILVTPSKVSDEFIIDSIDITKERGWSYQKGSKSERRKGTDGFEYNYKEGSITFPDDLNRPSRTIITGEGGISPSRFKHVILFKPTKAQINRLNLDSKNNQVIREKIGIKKSYWIRRLTPIELERLNGFPDDHTIGVTDGKRAFFMGNALVCGIISSIAESILFFENKK